MSSLDAIRRSSSDSGSSSSDRAALIEQLLLAGLDQYFSGQYEQAIHVWTRVFFLDRGHARARAYIERARGALAERQREAEAQGLDESSALGPTGAHPHGSGNGNGASAVSASRVVAVTGRTMTESAAARALAPRRFSRRDLLLGSSDLSPEEAVEIEVAELRAERERLEIRGELRGDLRSDLRGDLRSDLRADLRSDLRSESQPGTRLRTHVVLVTLAVVLLCSAAYVVLDRDRLATWWHMSTDPTIGFGTTIGATGVIGAAGATGAGISATAGEPIVTAEPLPVPHASEQALSRAHTLYERGRLHEAMRALTPIRVDDPLRHDADALLAEIERALLDSASASFAPPASPARSVMPTPTSTAIPPRLDVRSVTTSVSTDRAAVETAGMTFPSPNPPTNPSTCRRAPNRPRRSCWPICR